MINYNKQRQVFSLALGVLFLLSACITSKEAAYGSVKEKNTVVYIVRHAEKADPSDPDTQLSEEGFARADALAEKLRGIKVESIYATALRRTQETVSAVAAERDLTITALAPDDIDLLVSMINGEDKGKKILVAGHSNTVPNIVKALSGTDVPGIEEDQFDRIYTITLHPNGTSEVTVDHYGVRTP